MINFHNASFDYGGRSILSDVSLALETGAFYFLTGPSGSGKTTFLRLCYQALFPSKGSVEIFGVKNPHDRDAIALNRQRVGVVHQDCQFLDHLTVAENLMLPLEVSDRATDQDEANMMDLLNWVGLGDHGDALPPQLSGGERQRAALARAVITSPDVIIADEPTGNIDWEMGQRLLSLLVELNRMGKTVVIATHDLNLIRQAKSQVAARVLRIRNGHLEQAGAEL